MTTRACVFINFLGARRDRAGRRDALTPVRPPQEWHKAGDFETKALDKVEEVAKAGGDVASAD
jgi:hypothetical protein